MQKAIPLTVIKSKTVLTWTNKNFPAFKEGQTINTIEVTFDQIGTREDLKARVFFLLAKEQLKHTDVIACPHSVSWDWQQLPRVWTKTGLFAAGIGADFFLHFAFDFYRVKDIADADLVIKIGVKMVLH